MDYPDQFNNQEKYRAGGDLFFDIASVGVGNLLSKKGQVALDTTTAGIDILSAYLGKNAKDDENKLKNPNQSNSQQSSTRTPNNLQTHTPTQSTNQQPRNNSSSNTTNYNSAYNSLQTASQSLRQGNYSMTSDYLTRASRSLKAE